MFCFQYQPPKPKAKTSPGGAGDSPGYGRAPASQPGITQLPPFKYMHRIYKLKTHKKICCIQNPFGWSYRLYYIYLKFLAFTSKNNLFFVRGLILINGLFVSVFKGSKTKKKFMIFAGSFFELSVNVYVTMKIISIFYL